VFSSERKNNVVHREIYHLTIGRHLITEQVWPGIVAQPVILPTPEAEIKRIVI
jgi:hypothetical protein